MLRIIIQWFIVNTILTLGLYQSYGSVEWSQWMDFIVAIAAVSWLALISTAANELLKYWGLSFTKKDL